MEVVVELKLLRDGRLSASGPHSLPGLRIPACRPTLCVLVCSNCALTQSASGVKKLGVYHAVYPTQICPYFNVTELETR